MSKKRKYYEFPNPESEIGKLIKRRRLQMIIHSTAYYEFDTEFISDDKWQEWANELAGLLKKYPNEYSDRFDRYFEGWDGTTGYHLPSRDPWSYSTVQYYINNKVFS